MSLCQLKWVECSLLDGVDLPWRAGGLAGAGLDTPPAVALAHPRAPSSSLAPWRRWLIIELTGPGSWIWVTATGLWDDVDEAIIPANKGCLLDITVGRVLPGFQHNTDWIFPFKPELGQTLFFPPLSLSSVSRIKLWFLWCFYMYEMCSGSMILQCFLLRDWQATAWSSELVLRLEFIVKRTWQLFPMKRFLPPSWIVNAETDR